MFTNSPFKSSSGPEIDKTSQVVFVSDLFVEDYVGGAELTSQALIDASPLRIQKLRSKDVNLEVMEALADKHWIFGNFSQMKMDLIPTIIANLEYSVLEYDYKFCSWRSPQKHEATTGAPCDCNNQMIGKLISAFYYGAKSLWWMSEKQMEEYHNRFPFLDQKNNTVLSSVFDDKFFAAVKILRETRKDSDRSGWVVLGSESWVKGFDDAKKYCEDNSLKYDVLWNVPYAQVLERLSSAEGFVYLPKGWDTCPRMVIEAKLLGCKLILNDNVQHKDEEWFTSSDTVETESYLYAARKSFWEGIKNAMEWNPTISGYTTTKDCIKSDYPWRQSIKSLLGFCNEVVVVDGGSKDGTLEELRKWSETEPKLKVHLVERDWSHPRFAVFDGAQKAEARKRCTSQFLWQMDADEVVHESDYEKIVHLCKNFPSQADLISLPVVEFWGGSDKVRMDINPWKWRLSRNVPNITHGIPAQLRKSDAEGHLYASPGTDGCDYVHSETGELIPHASFYTADVHNARMAALSGHPQAQKDYEAWFKSIVAALPGVYHYSWFSLPRKIRTYRDYWSQHWQSLYNIKQEDTAENNMFFQRAWSDVTDADIETLSVRLQDEMGGWIFHSPVDFSRPTPHISMDGMTHPGVMVSK